MTTPTTPDQRAEKITVKGRTCKVFHFSRGCYVQTTIDRELAWLDRNGEWVHPAAAQEFWPTREAAEAFLETVRDPTPPSEPKCPECEGDKNLNLDHNDARAIHRIVRAMHDGECPKCHKVHPSDKMIDTVFEPFKGYRRVGWSCPSCHFTITSEEADAVFQIFAPFMERNLAIFLHRSEASWP